MEIESLRKELAEAQESIHTQAFIIRDGRECEERLKAEIEQLRSQLAATKQESPSHQLHAEIEQLKERNRLLLIKSREERQKLEEELAALRYRDESQSRRLAEKQARLDELETQAEEVKTDQALVQAELDRTLEELAQLKENPPPAIEQNPAPAIDLSDKAGKVASFFKTLLAKDTKLSKDIKHDKDIRLPKDTISKIEEILGGGDG